MVAAPVHSAAQRLQRPRSDGSARAPARHGAQLARPGDEVLQQQLQRHRRRPQQSRERWPWSTVPREDARVPAPHEPAEAGTTSSALLRLSERSAALYRHNLQLQRRLAALQAETTAVLNSFRRPAPSLGVLTPPSSPGSPWMAAPLADSWDCPLSPPPSPAGDSAVEEAAPLSPPSPAGPV